jgi:hypothetical protein
MEGEPFYMEGNNETKEMQMIRYAQIRLTLLAPFVLAVYKHYVFIWPFHTAAAMQYHLLIFLQRAKGNTGHVMILLQIE